MDRQTTNEPHTQTEPSLASNDKLAQQRQKLHEKRRHVPQRLIHSDSQQRAHLRGTRQGRSRFGLQEQHLLPAASRLRREVRGRRHVAARSNGLILPHESRLLDRHR